MNRLADIDIKQAAHEWRLLAVGAHDAYLAYLAEPTVVGANSKYEEYINARGKENAFFTRIGVDKKTFQSILFDLGLESRI